MSQLRTTWLCIATEGDTVDGRIIERQHLIEAAELYDYKLWAALIWPEHNHEVDPVGEVLEVMLDEDNNGNLQLLAINDMSLDNKVAPITTYLKRIVTPESKEFLDELLATANAYLLLDSGVTSQPFIDKVNDYINAQGHHGHGDDMQCFPMPETQHALKVTLFVQSVENFTAEELQKLKQDAGDLVRCAFRENTNYDVKKTWPYSRFSFSNLGRELHKQFTVLDSIVFSIPDIVSDLSVPRLTSLTVEVQNARV
ncbi:putative phage tail assembly chaperone [Providencia rettgeri]